MSNPQLHERMFDSVLRVERRHTFVGVSNRLSIESIGAMA